MASFGHPLDSFLEPKAPKTNTCTELLKAVAGLAMLCDHFGKMVFPQYAFLRLNGRLAFPLFAYCAALGVPYSRDQRAYLSRVVLLALLCQPLYATGLAHENPGMYRVPFAENPLLSCWTFYIQSWQKPSILLSLSLGLAILMLVRRRSFVLALGMYLLCERYASSLDYGIMGIRFMLLCYALLEHPLLYAPAITAFWLYWSLQGRGYSFFGLEFGMRIYALPAVLLTAVPFRRGHTLPRWLTYGFYPAHLAVLTFLTH